MHNQPRILRPEGVNRQIVDRMYAELGAAIFWSAHLRHYSWLGQHVSSERCTVIHPDPHAIAVGASPQGQDQRSPSSLTGSTLACDHPSRSKNLGQDCSISCIS